MVHLVQLIVEKIAEKIAAILRHLANSQTCFHQKAQKVLDTGGITYCEASLCPVQIAKWMAEEISYEPNLSGPLQYVNTSSPTLPPDQDPAWNNVKAFITEKRLFPTLDRLDYEVQYDIFTTMAKWCLSAALLIFKDHHPSKKYIFQASDYTCSSQSPTSTSSCPQMEFTFTSHQGASIVTTVSTVVRPSTFLIENTYD